METPALKEVVEQMPIGEKLEAAIVTAFNISCLYDSDFDKEPRWTCGGRTVGVGTFRPALDMTDTWAILKLINFELYEVRERFWEALNELVTGYGEAKHWPGALLHLHPSHICQAALYAKTVMGGVNQKGKHDS